MLDDLAERLRRRDPDFLQACLKLEDVPWQGGPLEPKVKELVLLAVDAAVTQLYAPGVRRHVEEALHHGATEGEIVEVLQLASVLGVHTCTVGVPILLEELAAAGLDDGIRDRAFTPREAELKERFMQVRGYWSELWDDILRLDAGFFEAYVGFSAAPWTSGSLDPKVRELVYIAIDASTTHLFEPGLRIHIRNALGLGATAAEIMEVFELTAQSGIHACAVGLPALDEVAPAVRAN